MIHSCNGPIHIWDKLGLKHNAPCMFAACGSSLMGHHTAREKFSLVGFIRVIFFTMRSYLSFDTLYRVNNNCYSSLGQRFKALNKTTVNC